MCAVDGGDLRRVQDGRRLARGRLLPLGLRQREDVDAAIGADDRETAVGKADIRDRGFQFLRRRLFALLDDRFRRLQDRLAFGIKAARAAGAAADRDGVGIALADADLVAVDAEVAAVNWT